MDNAAQQQNDDSRGRVPGEAQFQGPQHQGPQHQGPQHQGPLHQGRQHQDPQYQGIAATAQPLTAAEDRQWATLAHFGGILGFIPSMIIFLVFKDRGPFTAQESKEALNFTLPLTILAVIANLLSLIPAIQAPCAILAALIWVGIAVSSVLAGVRVNRGAPHRYAVNLRLIP